MIGIGTVLSFMGANKTTIIYVLVGLAVLSMFGTIKYQSMRLDTEKAGRQLAELNVATLEEKEKALQKEVKASAKRSEKLNKEIKKARDERNEKTAIYAKHDLANLATKKTSLITGKMRRATTAVWLSFEHTSGDGRGTDNMPQPARN
jgi:ABC-type lipopolysaccharide export system ATPase subunit